MGSRPWAARQPVSVLTSFDIFSASNMANTFALISVVTGIGGHFLNRKRVKGYTYFLILVVWPLLSFLLQGVLFVAGIEGAASPTAGALLFLLGLVAIWGSSVAQALKDRRAIRTGQGNDSAPRVTWEIVVLSLLVYAAGLYGIVGFVVTSHLQPGEKMPLFELSSSRQKNLTRLMPQGGGDIVLVGTLGYDGQPLVGTGLSLLFQDGYRTPEIKTNSLAAFEYRFPPGEWRFLGPLVVGHESRTVSVVFTPNMMRPTFQVAAGPPRTKVYMRIVVE
jgi:hypothetical protein